MTAGPLASAPSTAALPSRRRLWFGLVAGPAAWALHEMLSYAVAGQACTDGVARLGPLGEGGVRALLVVIAVGAVAAALAGMMVSWRNLRALRSAPETSPSRGRMHLMALAGVLVSVMALVGLLYAGLPTLLVDLCVRTR
jgi:hypothetical protein